MKHSAAPSRRQAVAGLIASPALLLAGARAEATGTLQAAIDDATRRGLSCRLPPGVTTTRGLTLPEGAHLVGARGGSTLRLAGSGPLLRGGRVSRIRVEGVRLEGARGDGHDGGLAQFHEVPRLTIENCQIVGAGRDGLRIERCGGRIGENTFRSIGRTGLFAIDSAGLGIDGNVIEDCEDNAIRVWRWKAGHDGTRVHGNRIRGVRSRSGGTGENGNGVSVYLADGVSVIGNDVGDCAWSALRNNSCRNVVFSRNVCANVGETAIWAEFAFRDVVITDNKVAGAGAGISMTNLAEHNGRGAICTGNEVRDIRPIVDASGKVLPNQRAIHAEADARIANNVVDGSPWVGINLGVGPYLQNVSVENNVIRNAPYGVGFTVAPGAGRGRIVGNRIGEAAKAAIVALRWEEAASGDLIGGCGAWAHIECADNRRI